MQELRFVGVEHDAVIATDEEGRRFRLVIDDGLREALRPLPAKRPEGPKVPPRVIQQLIRAGASVDEVVDRTGADRELVERFEGPILAERGYILEQARAVPVRTQHTVDPLAGEGTTFGIAIDERLEQLEAARVVWDAWRDPEEGWRIGLDFVADDVDRNALWSFDTKTRSLEAVSPAAITLSQQGRLPALAGPHLRAVDAHPTDAVIPVAERPRRDDPFTSAEADRATTNETADLLEQLRRRRGERSAAPYDEEAELHDFDEAPIPGFDGDEDAGWGLAPARDDAEADTAPVATVTPFAPRHRETAPESEAGPAERSHDGASAADAADAAEAAEAAEAAGAATAALDAADRGRPDASEAGGDAPARVVDVPLDGMEAPEQDEPRSAQAQRRRGGRPSMPSWDEIVFGTRTDDD